MAGTENQCLGIAEALNIRPVIKRIGLRQPWKFLSPWLGFEGSYSFTGDKLGPPWPDLLLASGRKSVAAARYIKKASGGKTFAVQIQDPRIDPACFDLVAVPAHDPARGDNVLVTTAAPNRLTQERLDAAKEQFSSLFSPLPAPRVAVLIGGSSKAHRMTPAVMEKLAAQLEPLNAGFMITASRRTDDACMDILKHALKGRHAFIWDGTGENPYFGMLAWADYILVTEDSVSMTSEAATTGKPVYTIPMEGGAARLDKFHEGLRKAGITRLFNGRLENWKYPPLQDAERVAQAIQDRLDWPALFHEKQE
ncbi:MAG: mitochondrial fission ELM1 family protein [Rhodospirillales bacterium]|nr:mitochondrial fission ELM1 family protein [Alphaproteobacteria bacterium]USO04615.1 MAG: mitochondrial fission ELM1 family protein [Rhodospirillales bacterium]